MAKKLIKRATVTALVPAEWPTPERNYLTMEQVPYLRSLIKDAQDKGYTSEEILLEWDAFVRNKPQQTPAAEGDEIMLEDAFRILFAEKSYSETKQHYAAFIDFANMEL